MIIILGRPCLNHRRHGVEIVDPLAKVRLGRTDVEVTRFGFGGAPLGERFLPVDNATADAIVEAAYAAGITYFDTAPQYGQGKSEARLGRVLQTKPRDSYVLSTKVGHLFAPPQDRARLRARDQGRRLPIRVPLGLQPRRRAALLRAQPAATWARTASTCWSSTTSTCSITARARWSTAHFRELTRGGGWRALEELKQSGEIRAIGCGVNQLGTIPEILERGEVDFFLVAMPYTLLDQGALDEEFPLCQARGVSVVIGAVFASGILATGPRENASYGYAAAPPGGAGEGPPHRAGLRGARRRACRRRHCSSRCSTRWSRRSSPAPGAQRTSATTSPPSARRFRLQFWSDLVAEELLRPDAPVGRAIVKRSRANPDREHPYERRQRRYVSIHGLSRSNSALAAMTSASA